MLEFHRVLGELVAWTGLGGEEVRELKKTLPDYSQQAKALKHQLHDHFHSSQMQEMDKYVREEGKLAEREKKEIIGGLGMNILCAEHRIHYRCGTDWI